MKGRILAAVAALLLTFTSGAALADVTLPSVIVKGTTIDGVRLGCTGAACGGYLESIGGVEVLPPHRPHTGMGEGGAGQLDITRAQFCHQLASQKPSGCDPASPPSVPVYDPMWEPNGCGTGGMEEIFYRMVMEGLYEDHFSGNLDAPTKTGNGQNISFLGACNHHDECWASAGNRVDCDNAFSSEMVAACGAATGLDWNACIGIAGVYRGAVSSDAATEHYQDTVGERECAAWAYDMRRNGCA